jgi:Transposase DDE domain group 1
MTFDAEFLRLEATKSRLTSMSGLQVLLEAFDKSKLKEPFTKCLPERISPRSQGNYRLGLIQLGSFIYGHDCLADLEGFRQDPALTHIMQGETPAPRTMGDFLRDFSKENINDFNIFLSTQAISYRKQLERMLKKQFKPSLEPHLSIDSTSHVQHGRKMEGLAYNYKDEWCLDSQVIFDELGMCWDLELRPGNTKSGVGAPEQIIRAFKSYNFKDKKYLSGDSAYCNQDVMKTCMGLGVSFTLTANQATTGWEDHLGEITEWVSWKYTDEEKREAAYFGYELDEVWLGRFYWQPSWNEVLRIPVVVKRTKLKKDEQTSLFSGGGEWKHYGVVTNHSLYDWTFQEVIEHHNKRGNAENFIREEEYGYDLKHFPCLELKANHAYGLIAMAAHNILRWTAIHENPGRPRFSKGLRNKFIFVPGIMVSHARLLVLRVSERVYEEVNRIREALELRPYGAKALTPIPTG